LKNMIFVHFCGE